MPAHFYAAQIILLLLQSHGHLICTKVFTRLLKIILRWWNCEAAEPYVTNTSQTLLDSSTCTLVLKKKKTGHVIIELFPKKIKNWPMYNQS